MSDNVIHARQIGPDGLKKAVSALAVSLLAPLVMASMCVNACKILQNDVTNDRKSLYNTAIGQDAQKGACTMQRRKAFSYLRVSGRGQLRGDGFPRQRAKIDRYAASNRIDIVEEFTDRAVKGATDLEQRADLARLIDSLESDGVRLVLVENADRLARDLMVGEIILSQLRDLGVQVISVEGDVDLTVGDEDPTRVLIRQVLGAVAQFDKSVIVLKLRAARERVRRERGRCEGEKPFGQSPSERAALARMLELRKQRRRGRPLGYRRIAATLNEEGHKPRYADQWGPSSVCSILKRHTSKRKR